VAIRLLALLLMVVMTACGWMDGRTDGLVALLLCFLNTIDEMNVRRIVHAVSVSSVLFFLSKSLCLHVIGSSREGG
jgi:hypothetical protein